MQGLQALLASRRKRRRAVVSLPTGGGKTRVTVEASVRLVLALEGDNRNIVWVAQADELLRACSAGLPISLGQSWRATNLEGRVGKEARSGH